MDSTATKQMFRRAGLFNIVGMLIVSKGLGPNLGKVDSLFDFDGCVSVILWGMAYAAVGECYEHAPWVSLVFALEKLFYFLRWAGFWNAYAGTVAGLLAEDPSYSFFLVFGPLDLVWGLFFLKIFLDYRNGSTARIQEKKRLAKPLGTLIGLHSS